MVSTCLVHVARWNSFSFSYFLLFCISEFIVYFWPVSCLDDNHLHFPSSSDANWPLTSVPALPGLLLYFPHHTATSFSRPRPLGNDLLKLERCLSLSCGHPSHPMLNCNRLLYTSHPVHQRRSPCENAQIVSNNRRDTRKSRRGLVYTPAAFPTDY